MESIDSGAAQCVDYSFGYGCSVEPRGGGGERRRGVVATIQRTEFLGTRWRQTARSFWPRQKRPVEGGGRIRTFFARCLGPTCFPDGVRPGEPETRHGVHRSAHRQDSVATRG